VPEHHPVPSFVTGEQWDFGGTWAGATSPPGLKPPAAEPGLCVDGFELRLDDQRRGILLF
jgi:hypothetical protein